MIDDEEISLIDTNILIYAIDNDEKQKQKIAREIIEKCWKKEKIYCLSVQNLSEFYVNATKFIKNPISTDYAKLIISDICSFDYFKILEIKKDSINSAVNISIKYDIDYWDALIAATMQENNINIIITENTKDFKKIPWIRVISPFKR